MSECEEVTLKDKLMIYAMLILREMDHRRDYLGNYGSQASEIANAIIRFRAYQ